MNFAGPVRSALLEKRERVEDRFSLLRSDRFDVAVLECLTRHRGDVARCKSVNRDVCPGGAAHMEAGKFAVS